MKKILLTLLYMLILLIIIASAVLYFNRNIIIERLAEKAGTQSLGVKVDIGSVDLSLADKKLIVNNIAIANPKGYKGKELMEIGKVEVGLNMFNKQLIDFDKIEVKESVINVEVNSKGININDLKKKLDSNKSETPKESDTEKAIRVIVQRATVKATKINTRITFMNRDLASFTMPDITLTDIGKKGGGTSAKAAITTVFSKLINDVQARVSKNLSLNGIKLPNFDGLKNSLDNAKDSVNGSINKTKEDLNKTVDDTKKNVKDSFKGIFSK